MCSSSQYEKNQLRKLYEEDGLTFYQYKEYKEMLK